MQKKVAIASIAWLAALSSIIVIANTWLAQASNDGSGSTTSSTQQTKTFDGERGWKGGRKGPGWEMGMFDGWLGMEWGRGGHMFLNNTWAQTAITNNDYAAFQTAIKGTKSEGKITQDEFNKLVRAAQKKAAVDAAIEANDYDAFVEATKPTKEEFATIVKQHQTRAAVEVAVKNNDYAAFQTAVKWSPMENVTQAEFTKMVDHQTSKTSKNQ